MTKILVQRINKKSGHETFLWPPWLLFVRLLIYLFGIGQMVHHVRTIPRQELPWHMPAHTCRIGCICSDPQSVRQIHSVTVLPQGKPWQLDTGDFGGSDFSLLQASYPSLIWSPFQKFISKVSLLYMVLDKYTVILSQLATAGLTLFLNPPEYQFQIPSGCCWSRREARPPGSVCRIKIRSRMDQLVWKFIFQLRCDIIN